MSRRTLLGASATLALLGALLLSAGLLNSGSLISDPTATTPSPSSSGGPTTAPSESASRYPIAPSDPSNACDFIKAVYASAEDNQRFGTLALTGEDLPALASAIDEYVRETSDWVELVDALLAAHPIASNPDEAAQAAESLRIVSEVPQSIAYLAAVIRGEATDQTLEETAANFADPDGYPALFVVYGWELALCGARLR